MKKTQEEIGKFCMENNLESPAEYRLLDIISELGEVSKEILKETDYGKKSLEYRKEIKEEIGDVLFSLITLANSLDIDLEKALDTVLQKYKRRIKKGGAGSENE